MIKITNSILVHPHQMYEIMRAIGSFLSLGTGHYGIIARFEIDAPLIDTDQAAAILEGYGQMLIESDKASIMADDLDTATITATAGPSDTEIRFDVWDSENDHAIENVVVPVVGGEAIYTFKTALPERYSIFAHGKMSHQTGSVEVVANE